MARAPRVAGLRSIGEEARQQRRSSPEFHDAVQAAGLHQFNERFDDVSVGLSEAR